MSRRPIVILTALDLEYQAIRERLTDLRLHRHQQGTRFEIGRLARSRCRVALAHVGKGNQSAAVLAERAVNEFTPTAVFFVGVAGALHSHIALGDVVVATHVYAFHSGTSQDDGFKSRPRVWETSHSVDQIARHIARSQSWMRDLPAGDRNPEVHFGPIAAGEVVAMALPRRAMATWCLSGQRYQPIAGPPHRFAGGRTTTSEPGVRAGRAHHGAAVVGQPRSAIRLWL